MSSVSTFISSSFTPFKKSVIYQIYPSSFKDSNGDGFGDLNGIIQKADHLQFLGVDYIWICPIYKSPLRDMGYDISDYKTIDPKYGTIEDWDLLAYELKKRNIGIIMDLVANHTSHEHSWFLSSRSSRTDPKRDWYIWKSARYTETGERLEPNNWVSEFGGSAWEWDEETQEYYLHLYDPGQPDLNWENPDVRDAVYEIMEWWIARGCAGFRLDVINKISKVPGLPDAPISNIHSKYQLARDLYINGMVLNIVRPRVHEFIQEMHQRVLAKYPNVITVGETPYTEDAAEVVKYVQPERKELNMVFVFELQKLDQSSPAALTSKSFTLPEFKAVIARWQTYMHSHNGWNTVFLENHDMARSVSRYLPLRSDSPADLKSRGAKLLAMLCCTLSGTLFVYQGQEIGMSNVPSTWGIEMFRDVAALNYYREILSKRTTIDSPHPDMTDVLEGICRKGRDNARTPMQWSSARNSGFTTDDHDVKPWITVNPNYPTCNVEQQCNDHTSVLQFWKRLIRLRKANECLTIGIFTLLSPEHPHIFAYTLVYDSIIFLIVLNFSTQEIEYTDGIGPSEPETALKTFAKCLASNMIGPQASDQSINLQSFKIRLSPLEGRVYGTFSEK